MTNQLTAFDSGIECRPMPSKESTIGIVDNLLQSSTDILTELFCSLNAKPPVSLEIFGSVAKRSNKHHKKNKKHRHSSHKHKRKQSKKSKRHKKMSSTVPIPIDIGIPVLEICRPRPSTPLPNDISNMDNSRPTSESTEDVKSRPSRPTRPSYSEDDYVHIQNLDQSRFFRKTHIGLEVEMIPQEIKLGLDIELDKPAPILGEFKHGLVINDMETKPSEIMIIEENRMVFQNKKSSSTRAIDDLGEERELDLSIRPSPIGLQSIDLCKSETVHSKEVLSSVIFCEALETENTQQSRNRSKSQGVDHHLKKASMAKDDSHRNRKNRSRSQSFDHKSKDRRKRSISLGKRVCCDEQKKKRSCSRDRKGKVVLKKRQSIRCDDSSHLEVNHNKIRERGKRSKSRSRSRDKRKRSISDEDRSSGRKNTMRRQHRSVSKDKKIVRKERDRSRSSDQKQRMSRDRSMNEKRKSRSRNRSAGPENTNHSASRERSTSKSRIQDNESFSKILMEHIKSKEADNNSQLKTSRSRTKAVDKPMSDNRSTFLPYDTAVPQSEHRNEDSKTDSKVSLSKDVDCYKSRRKDKSNDVDNSETEKRHRKRRSKSIDSSSPKKRTKRKNRSSSKSHIKDSEKADRRRRSSESKDNDIGRKDRRSRSKSKSRHSQKVDRAKKSKSKDREDRSKNKFRSKSKDTESHNAGRKSRSRSRDKAKSSYRTAKRSRSRSPNRSHRSSARKRRSRSREVHIDKRKLFEIARKNAMTMLKQAAAPFGAENLVAIKAGGKSVEELTDFCKQLSKKEAGVSSDSEDEDPDVHHSDSDVERPFHHPFQLKERPTNIVLNIRNSVSVPTKTFQEKTAEQSKQLRLQFPVSSGQNHRKTESEWVPVAPGQPSTSTQSTCNASQSVQPLSHAISSPVLNAVQTDSPINSSVFPQAPASPPDIGNIVEKRVNAMRKLNANPNDSHAISQIYQVNQQMSMWLASKQQPGQFTGSTGAKVLTAAQLSTGYQAWAKKDQLMSAAPVSGGMGMALLQKMGWRPGEGLGKNKEGSLEPLKLEVKMDKKGLVAQEELSSKHQNSGRQHQRTTTLAGKHPVSLLVEFCSKRHWDSPQFHVCFECGPDHKKNFLFKVRVNGTEYQPSVASNNKKQAKAEAARLCLQTLGLLYPEPPK